MAKKLNKTEPAERLDTPGAAESRPERQPEKQPAKPAEYTNAGRPGNLLSKEALLQLSELTRRQVKATLITAAQLPPRPPKSPGQGPPGPPQPPNPPGPDQVQANLVLNRDLASLVPGCELTGPEGHCYLVERTVASFAPDHGHLQREYRRTFCGGGLSGSLESWHKSVRPLAESAIGGVAYLDIETCGMAGMAAFLVGLLSWQGEALVLRQFLARNYAEERAMLARTWEELDRAATLVTFNGASFDVPFIEDRAAVVGLGSRRISARHVDLLHESRRRWKKMLPNCKLQTLEHFICGRLRRGDIPGADIPAVYHEFVRTGDARQMAMVLHHNALDLLTLAELTVCVLQNHDGGLT